ncbi:MAG: hypothetical protein AAF587_20535 [Bacteroidota bacterium]
MKNFLILLILASAVFASGCQSNKSEYPPKELIISVSKQRSYGGQYKGQARGLHLESYRDDYTREIELYSFSGKVILAARKNLETQTLSIQFFNQKREICL